MKEHHLPYIRITLVLIVTVFGLSYFVFWKKQYEAKIIPIVIATSRAQDATYTLDAQPIDFINGRVENKTGIFFPDTIEARMIGDPVGGEVNQDTLPDQAVWFSYTTKEGISYYVAVALQTTDGFVGTNAVLLGSMIAPQTLEIQDGVIVAHYTTRKEGESMATAPSVGISKYFKVTNGVLVETTKPVLPSEGCAGVRGTFDTKNKECLGISAGQCSVIGGVFNECASACRNNPKAKVCTLQCVQICQFK